MTARGLLARRGTFVLDVARLDADSSGTAVLGPNGAGKTTLLLALQGLIPATGEIERPARCAAVFARPAVLRGTALWNISTVVRRVLGATPADADVRGHAMLADVGLSDVAAADARTLSTGQRQRLALARALGCEPQALFLDEPFANVDADGRPALRALVRSYAECSGCALVLATSSLADAAALCKGAVVLQKGAVRHEGAVVTLPAADDIYVKALFSEYRVTS
ncbi:MAG TPA: ATP-binding cassette domain-containing protein [Candidatus Elarobacter sp.]|nr:ATP-binding cassette domain-containing protein [Candidatus Elarobacter sp.]